MFKNIFNIILLSLILTTFLITVISYIVFRIRQLAGTKKAKNLHHLDGVYFSRYAPVLEDANIAHAQKVDAENLDRISPRTKMILVTVLSFGIVLLLLLFENHFNFRKEILERANSAKVYRDLISRGLLKKRTFDPLGRTVEVGQDLTPLQLSAKQQGLMELSKTPIAILLDSRSRNRANAEAWIAFCARLQLKCQLKKDVPNTSSGILIIPEPISFSSSLFKKLKKFNRVIWSGESSAKRDSVAELFGLTRKEGDCLSYASLLEAGIVAGNIPHDEFSRIKVPYYDSVNSSFPFVAFKGGKVWVAQAPLRRGGQFIDRFEDYAFLQILLHAKEGLSLTLLPRDSLLSSVSLAIWLDEGKDSEFLVDLLEKFNFPVTLISSNNSFPHEFSHLNIEMALNGDTLMSTGGSLKTLFEAIEEQRFSFEEGSQRLVDGIWFSKLRPNSDALEALRQNEFQYLVNLGDSSFEDYPYWKNNLWMFSDADLKDSLVLKDKTIAQVDEAVEYFWTKISEHIAVKRWIRLFFDQSLYEGPFAQLFLQKILQKVSQESSVRFMSEISAHLYSLNNLVFSYHLQGREIKVNLVNHGGKTIEQVHLFFKSDVFSLMPDTEYALRLWAQGSVVTLKNIQPGKNEITLKLK